MVQQPFGAEEVHAPLVDLLVELGADQLADRALGTRAADTSRRPRPLGGQTLRLRAQPQLGEPVAQHGGAPLRARRPQCGGVGDRARTAPAAAAAERGALVHQRGHRDGPAVADLAEPVFVRDAGVGEVHLVELGLARHLAQRPGLHPGPVHVDDKVGQALVFGHIRIGAGQQQTPARLVRQAGPHLLPVDHPVVAVAHRAGGQPRQVRSGTGLGEQLAPDVLGGGQRPQPLPLDLLGLGVLADGRCRHAVTHRVEPERHRPAGALQDPVGDGLQAARHPEPAQPLREVHPGQAGVVAGAEELRDGHHLRVVLGDDLAGQRSYPFGISVVAHAGQNRHLSSGRVVRPCRGARCCRTAPPGTPRVPRRCPRARHRTV